MFRNTFRTGPALLALVAGLGLANPAPAQTVPHKESATGRLTLVTATEMQFVAAGHGTHLGKYTEVGSHFYFPDGTLFGGFTQTAADGATISGTYAGTFAPIGGGFFQFEVTVEWLAGTGRLEGVTGTGTVSAILDGATGNIVIEASGVWDL